jgi:rubrerythrin
MTVAAEKDSIAFYTGLKNFVPSEVAKDKIGDVIGQEMGHIIILNRQLASLK